MAAPLLAVDGARQLRRTLRRAGDDLQELRAIHATVAAYVAAAAVSAAPRGPTGRLAASVRGSGTKTHATIRAGRKAVPYAGPIHWGWPARHIPANPFMVNAATGSEATWVDMYTQGVEAVLAKVEGV